MDGNSMVNWNNKGLCKTSLWGYCLPTEFSCILYRHCQNGRTVWKASSRLASHEMLLANKVREHKPRDRFLFFYRIVLIALGQDIAVASGRGNEDWGGPSSSRKFPAVGQLSRTGWLLQEVGGEGGGGEAPCRFSACNVAACWVHIKGGSLSLAWGRVTVLCGTRDPWIIGQLVTLV